MSNIIQHDSSRQSLYIQSVEKEQDSLALRKKIAHDLGLTSIGEFIQGWAVGYKDNTWRLINEEGEYMRDPRIKDLTYKRVDISRKGYTGLEYKEGHMNGNGDFIEKEEDNTDIIQSKHWIFSAKDGIIIVVDHRGFCDARLYTTDGEPIILPEGRQLDCQAIPDRGGYYSINDKFSQLREYNFASTDINSSVFDRRKNIIHGRFAVDITSEMSSKLYYNDKDNFKKRHNQFNACAYSFMDPQGNFFRTELGDCYANTKRSFDGSCGLFPCVHPVLSNCIQWQDERHKYKQERPVFYAVDMEGKTFEDEFGYIVMFDDPFWLHNFDAEGYAPIVIDRKISRIPGNWDYPDPYRDRACICFINTSGEYRRSSDKKVVSIPFHKTQEEYTVTSNDVKGYRLFPNQGFIEVRQLSTTQPGFQGIDKEIYKYYDYKGNEVQKDTYLDNKGHEPWMRNIEWGNTENRVYKDIGNSIIVYGYGTKINIDDYDGSEYIQGGKTKIVNTKIGYKNIRFPDGIDTFDCKLDRNIESFSKGFFFYDNLSSPIQHTAEDGKTIDQRGSYAHIKINGLIARYTKDNEGNQLLGINNMQVSVDEKYLFIQWKPEGPYCILDKHFSYIKNKHGDKLTFNCVPFYVDGMFLSYDYHPSISTHRRYIEDKLLKEAYFEDGTLVGQEPEDKETLASIQDTTTPKIGGILKA